MIENVFQGEDFSFWNEIVGTHTHKIHKMHAAVALSHMEATYHLLEVQ